MPSKRLTHILPLLLMLASSALRAEEPAAAAAPDTAATPAANQDREQQLATALRRQLKEGELLSLDIEGRPVLALFSQQTRGEALGGVLLLHDLNNHPDSPGVIHTLRLKLPDAGWHTLSIQLPPAESTQPKAAQLDDLRKRINAGLAEMEARAIKNIVIIGHGLGAHAAVDFLAENLAPSVQGLVVIGLDGSGRDEERLDAAQTLAKINLPILDIYGGRDLPQVVSSAKRRYDLARRTTSAGMEARRSYADIALEYSEEKALSLSYRQVRVPAADHHFSGVTDNLEKRLRGWLKRYAAGSEVNASTTPETTP